MKLYHLQETDTIVNNHIKLTKPITERQEEEKKRLLLVLDQTLSQK